MATGRRFDPRRLDVRAFAAAGAALEGDWPLATLPRLASAGIEASIGDALAVRWRVLGGRNVLPSAGSQPTLDIHADAILQMQCQRCLEPVTVPLLVEHRVYFVEGDDTADALDVESEEDVLALEPALDLRILLEDELLLALPLIPRHEVCADPLPRAADAPRESTRAHPFAALAALKSGGGS